MLASTFMDMVLGVDIHFEMVPMPAPVPTPLPNPFVGMVFDPGGLLTGQAMSMAMALLTGTPPKGPVLINCMPATTCGTNAKNALGMPHILIPPGTAWAPMPKLPKPAIKGPPPAPGPPVAPEGDAISVFGSQTVTFMGSSAVRMGDKSMSCGEPVRLPSSTVLAIPKGAPVMVGGPPALSIADAVGALLKSKWVAGYLHDLLSRMAPGRLRNLLSKAVCFVTGHPVDVASGRVLTDHVDFELPGPLPLKFERNYASSWANRAGPLGHGWSHSLDQAVWAERGKIVYLDAEGRELEFDTFDFPDHVLPAGGSVFDPISALTLKSLGHRRFEITTREGLTSTFEPVPGATGARQWWSRLTRQTTRTGATVALEYDRAANLAWATDSAGRQVAFEHDRAGRLLTVKLPHPTQHGWEVHTRYAYDAEGDLVRVTDPLGNSWKLAYKQHLLVQETNRNGLSFYFAYDGHGEDAFCVRTWGDGGIYDHVIDYDKVGKVTCVTNSLGHTTTYKMNVVGCVTEVMDPLGGTTRYDYDERTLRKVKETNPVGGETTWAYDARGNCTKVVGPDQAEVTVDFSPENQALRARDPVKGQWTWGYDAQGRMLGRVDPPGRRVQFHWAAEGRTGLKRLTSLTDPAGQDTALGYDGQGNVIRLRTPDSAESRWTYDNLGRCTAAIDPKGNAQRREHDALGRVVRVSEPDGNVRELAYDPEGNVIHARDKQHDVRFTYQGMGRIASRTEAGTTVGFSYDTEENLVAITNEHGHVYAFELDACGRIEVESGFDGLRRRYMRDKAGRVVKVFRPAERTTEYAYDDAGRVAAVQYSSGESEAYAYRPDGELVEAKNDAATVKLERDLLGRIVREVVGDDWVGSEYDALGARVRVTSSKGLDERITRDAMGRAVGIHASVDNQVWDARIVRDIMGLEIERHLPGGVQSRWERDAVGRPVKQEVWAAGQFRRAVQYTWDVGDRLKMVVDALRGPTHYEHDALGNLAAATYADGHVDLRMPDAVGNLFRTRDRTDRKYGPAGQLLEARREDGGLTTYDYDPEGNLIRKTEHALGAGAAARVWRYEWNGAGMLARVVRPNGSELRYAYDVFARRLRASFGGQVRHVLWDHEVPLHRCETAPPHEGANGVSRTWVFMPSTFAPLAQLSDAAILSAVTDQIGAPAALYDGSGAEIWSGAVDLHGQPRLFARFITEWPFWWQGQESDSATGLLYNRHRYYDPQASTFLSPDPLGIVGGLALYAHVPDPLIWIDPLGLSCKTEGQQNLREMGLEEVELAGKSFNSGRKSLEDAGFKFVETTDTGRRIFEHPRTGTRVTFDSGQALVSGQRPHWEISDRGGTRYTRSGRPVTGPSPIMGGKHIPAG